MEGRQRVLGVQRDLAQVLPRSTKNENTKYSVGDDIFILLDEILNNKTRSILIYDDFSGRFTDLELYQLSVVMKYNTSLVAVTISGVDIGDETVALLCQSMIPTNVQYVDFTSTPLEEEAGSSLAALARCNTNVRTVIVTDTLIDEDMQDEIDVACMDNEIANGAPRVAVPDPNRPMYCAAHALQACPNGDYCLLSHAPPGTAGGSRGESLDWDRALPPQPKEGATWRADDDDVKPKLRVNLEMLRRREEKKKRRADDEEDGRAVQQGQQHSVEDGRRTETLAASGDSARSASSGGSANVLIGVSVLALFSIVLTAAIFIRQRRLTNR